MFSFANPGYLYLLLLLPVVAGAHLLARRARKRKLARYGKQQVIGDLMPNVSPYKPWIKLSLELLLLALVVVIIARPRAGVGKTTEHVNGIEVMVAVDVSNSMNASTTDNPQDISRLQRAKLILEKLIDRLQGNKVGLIVFAGNAYMQMPLTGDASSAKLFLAGINTNMVPTQGTAIGAAIDMAAQSFSTSKKTQKSIIIITDGENFEDDATGAAQRAHEMGIQVNVLGVGSPNGAPIPMPGEGYLTDDTGEPVTTYLNEKMAQDIAVAGKGTYVSGNANDALETLQDTLDKLGKSNLATISYTKHDEQFPVFAWIAVVVLIALIILLEAKNPWLDHFNFFTKKTMKHSVVLLVALLAFSMASTPAMAQDNSNKKERNHIRSGNKLYNEKRYAEAEVEYNKALQANPTSGIANFNLATALLRQGNGTAKQDDENNPSRRAEELLNNLVKSTPDRSLQAQAYYDLGNLAYSRQDYGQAIEHYKNALRRNPSDNEARENLRLAQLKKQEQDKNNQDNKDNKDNKNDKNDKNEKNDKNDKNDKKDNKDNKDQNKGDQDKKDQPQKPQQQQQGGMSQQNMEQILKTMQDKENATQQRVQAVQARQQQHERNRTNRKW